MNTIIKMKTLRTWKKKQTTQKNNNINIVICIYFARLPYDQNNSHNYANSVQYIKIYLLYLWIWG
jgi:hypothetical protein